MNQTTEAKDKTGNAHQSGPRYILCLDGKPANFQTDRHGIDCWLYYVAPARIGNRDVVKNYTLREGNRLKKAVRECQERNNWDGGTITLIRVK